MEVHGRQTTEMALGIEITHCFLALCLNLSYRKLQFAKILETSYTPSLIHFQIGIH